MAYAANGVPIPPMLPTPCEVPGCSGHMGTLPWGRCTVCGTAPNVKQAEPSGPSYTDRVQEEARRQRLAEAKGDLYRLRRVEESLRRNLCLSGAACEAEMLALDGHLAPALRMAEALLERARG